MSLNQFITEILNIKEDDLEDIQPFKQSDDTLLIKLKLKNHQPLCLLESVRNSLFLSSENSQN